MNVRWKKLLVTTTLWLTTEIWFNFLGIDNLADYSEFIFDRNAVCKADLFESAQLLIVKY
jgi:hypothetical protein